MNDLPGMPPIVTPPPSASPNRLGGILIGVLGLGAVVFALLTVYAFSQAISAKSNLDAKAKAAADAARVDQQKQDQKTNALAAEAPFRTYQAPSSFGSFKINFPKNWSATVDEEENSSTQVTLVMNPDFIRRGNNADLPDAAKVVLVQRTLDQAISQYASSKSITKTSITVSAIQSTQLTGTFNDKKTIKMVFVPVRDKTIVFSTENATYSKEFDLILAQSVIIP